MANAFGISRASVSKIVRTVCFAITKHLGPIYITMPTTEEEVLKMAKILSKDMVFHNALEPLMAHMCSLSHHIQIQLITSIGKTDTPLTSKQFVTIDIVSLMWL